MRNYVRMGQNILIIEDDIQLREYTAELLKRAGHTVRQLGDADDLVNVVRQMQVDLILMDYHLPGIDGLLALRELRNVQQSVPVIVMTVDVSPQVIIECFRAGADDFIGKPYDEVYLSIIVERTLDRASNSLKNAVFRLMKYARHKDNCDNMGPKMCSCGLQDAVWEATQATRILKDS
jgi:DNA-binding response OmpR family regulator